MDDHSTATRTAYDEVAADYAELLRDALAEAPLERGLLTAFAELVGVGPVADLGCGPGRITPYLADLGLDVFGLDLSPGMVEVARRDHPELRFEVGSLAELDLADGSLGGVLAWYSLIHTPPHDQRAVLDEFARVLRPDGHLLLAFQVGEDDVVHHEHVYGHDVSFDGWRMSPQRVAHDLQAAGFSLHTKVIQEPSGPWQKTQQAYLMATLTEPVTSPRADEARR